MKAPLLRQHAIVAFAVTAVVFAAAAPAAACSCAGEPEASSAAGMADVVFEGTVLGQPEAVRAQLGLAGYDGATRVRFQVARYFKGQLGSEATIYTIDQDSACGRFYSPGSPYVVYGRWEGDSLLTDNLCSRTRLLSQAAEDLALLGQGIAPDPGILPRDVLAEGMSPDVGCGVGAGGATSPLSGLSNPLSGLSNPLSALSSGLLFALVLLRRRSARG